MHFRCAGPFNILRTDRVPMGRIALARMTSNPRVWGSGGCDLPQKDALSSWDERNGAQDATFKAIKMMEHRQSHSIVTTWWQRFWTAACGSDSTLSRNPHPSHPLSPPAPPTTPSTSQMCILVRTAALLKVALLYNKWRRQKTVFWGSRCVLHSGSCFSSSAVWDSAVRSPLIILSTLYHYFWLQMSLLPSAHGSEIMKGKKVPDGEMLYMASVQNAKGKHICGGFLIRRDIVVTAAHCDDKWATSILSLWKKKIAEQDINWLLCRFNLSLSVQSTDKCCSRHSQSEQNKEDHEV